MSSKQFHESRSLIDQKLRDMSLKGKVVPVLNYVPTA